MKKLLSLGLIMWGSAANAQNAVATQGQEGWGMMQKEISAHESFYTQEKCARVGKGWAKITATMRKK
jgi:hypothetical protein